MIPSHFLRDSSGDKQARGSSYYSHTTPIPESLEVWEWYLKLMGRSTDKAGKLET